jgi:hypothetical protein
LHPFGRKKKEQEKKKTEHHNSFFFFFRNKRDMGLRLYRDHVISHVEVEKKTVSELLQQIEHERFQPNKRTKIKLTLQLSHLLQQKGVAKPLTELC